MQTSLLADVDLVKLTNSIEIRYFKNFEFKSYSKIDNNFELLKILHTEHKSINLQRINQINVILKRAVTFVLELY